MVTFVAQSAFLAMATVALSGCFSDEPVHTAEWYKEHDSDRQEKLKACSDNPGELRDTPNCVNALQAERVLSSGELFELDF
ncbi:hypothetical protein J057_24025 [Marinobacter nanhaiticus D15-8W]|uniref:EexN family lipoprotein n=2 Tax=Marinobacter TaxID=2742 RepID=A0A371CGE0_9GAMM|nr:hypothetical protein J057_24025 [Marinobacter nanhaiticus D15-8W]